MAAMLALVFGLRALRAMTGTRVPTSEKLLRPPGESMNCKLAEFDEKLTFTFVLMIVGPLIFAAQTLTIAPGLFLALRIPFTAVCAVPMALVAFKRRNHALGHLGERAVGEELNQLLRDGCHVFHDYPGGPNWNINHIVVAPPGVYPIETKTRHKRRGRQRGRS